MSKLSDYSKFDHLVDSSDDDEEEDNKNVRQQRQQQQQQQQQPTPQALQTPASPAPLSLQPQQVVQQQQDQETAGSEFLQRPHGSKSGRFIFYHAASGNTIYEWEQKLEEVTLFVRPPIFVQKGNQVRCNIFPNRLQLGLVNANPPWFINEETFGTVDVSESTWSLEEDEENETEKDSASASSSAVSKHQQKVICIYLIKAQKGLLWDGALKGARVGTAKLDPMAQEQVRKDLLLERFQEENPGFDFRDAEFNGSVPDARKFMGGVKYS